MPSPQHLALSDRAPAQPRDDIVLRLRGAGLSFGSRLLWSGLDLDVRAGEFIAVLGANGSGKTTLLRSVLGQQKLQEGSIEIDGRAARRGDRRIGYVPQQRLAADGTPLRARDLVGLGIDGHRWGIPLPSRRRRGEVASLLDTVGARGYASSPVDQLSGGEQQRVRIGQALAGDPRLLLCDEPLISLDPANQRLVSELIDHHRHDRALGVLFVTHDVNPILPMVDRILYLAGGRFRIGTPQEVLRSDVLTELYGSPIEVIEAAGRIIVVGSSEEGHIP